MSSTPSGKTREEAREARRRAQSESIREAARREAARAPRFVPGSPQWNRLAAIWASVPALPRPGSAETGPEGGSDAEA